MMIAATVVALRVEGEEAALVALISFSRRYVIFRDAAVFWPICGRCRPVLFSMLLTGRNMFWKCKIFIAGDVCVYEQEDNFNS